MKRVTLLILLFCNLNLIFSQEINYTKLPQLQTSAIYTTEVSPDKIVLGILLSESDTKGKTSLEELELKMKKVLTDNAIDINKQLTLSDLSSDFRDFFLKKTDVHKRKTYELQVYDANTASIILRELERENISNVQLLKTEYTKLEELKIELKGKAILKAKKQAEEMVKNLNQTLGPAIFISDLETNISDYNLKRLQGLNSLNYSDIEVLNVDFDKIRVDAKVTVYFKLE